MKKQVKYLLFIAKIKSLKLIITFYNTLSIWAATFLLPTKTNFFIVIHASFNAYSFFYIGSYNSDF